MVPSFLTSHLDGLGELPPSGDAPSYLRSSVLSGLGADTPAAPAASSDLQTMLVRIAIIAAVTVLILKMMNKK